MKRYMIETSSEEETKKIGNRLGRCLQKGDIVAFIGDLGAGKTHFAMGVANSLGITDYITSPTFTIVNEYRSGSIAMFHFDAYRLSCSDELLEIGFDDYVAAEGIILIEWADIVEDILPSQVIRVGIERMDAVDINKRKIMIEIPEGEDRFDDIWD